MNPRVKQPRGIVAAAAFVALVAPLHAQAGIVSLGNQDFASGTFPTLGLFNTAQVGEPAPIGFNGTDDSPGGDFSATWTFSFAPGTITAASITIGMWDHDSAASGDQVKSFLVDGISLNTAMNALFNAPGRGTNEQYDVFTLPITGAALAALADGSVTFTLALGPPALCPGPAAGTTIQCQPGNGAGFDFATLNYTLAAVPEPATLALLGLGLAGLAATRRRRPG